MSNTLRWRSILKWGVVAIVALLALAVIVPRVIEKYSGSSYQHAMWYRDLLAIRSALDEYAVRNEGRYPARFEELLTPDSNGHQLLDCSRIPSDPWRSPYVYVGPAAQGAKPTVFSCGPDGKPGTDDDLHLNDE